MSSNLFLITNHYPYGKGETFIDNEVPYLVNAFKRVVILAREKDKTITRSVNGFTHYRQSPASTFGEKMVTLLYILSRIKLYRQLYQKEKEYMKNHGIVITRARMKQMRHFLIKSFEIAKMTEKILSKEHVSGNVILYSYWLNPAALGITLVRNVNVSIKTIARGHGGDIHEFRHKTGYLPFRNVLCERLDKVVISATAGRNHFVNLVNENVRHKVITSHLGTVSFGDGPDKPTSEKKVVVTCSNMVDVKRIDWVIRALATMPDTKIHWIHIGDGPLRMGLEELAETLLRNKPGLSYEFKGYKTHDEVMDFYRNHYIDVFINSSSSEATPVSIMEANSFGVPAIGFDVGGVGDIVNEKTGILLGGNDGYKELALAIERLLGMSVSEMSELRRNARKNWKEKYHADVAYQRFIDILKNL